MLHQFFQNLIRQAFYNQHACSDLQIECKYSLNKQEYTIDGEQNATTDQVSVLLSQLDIHSVEDWLECLAITNHQESASYSAQFGLKHSLNLELTESVDNQVFKVEIKLLRLIKTDYVFLVIYPISTINEYGINLDLSNITLTNENQEVIMNLKHFIETFFEEEYRDGLIEAINNYMLLNKTAD